MFMQSIIKGWNDACLQSIIIQFAQPSSLFNQLQECSMHLWSRAVHEWPEKKNFEEKI